MTEDKAREILSTKYPDEPDFVERVITVMKKNGSIEPEAQARDPAPPEAQPLERETTLARNRIIVDVITEEPMSDTRLRTLARETNDWVHTIGVEPDDVVLETEENNMHGHIHVSTRNEYCIKCVEAAQDRLQ